MSQDKRRYDQYHAQYSGELLKMAQGISGSADVGRQIVEGIFGELQKKLREDFTHRQIISYLYSSTRDKAFNHARFISKEASNQVASLLKHRQ
jgi:hypothetical protein